MNRVFDQHEVVTSATEESDTRIIFDGTGLTGKEYLSVLRWKLKDELSYIAGMIAHPSFRSMFLEHGKRSQFVYNQDVLRRSQG